MYNSKSHIWPLGTLGEDTIIKGRVGWRGYKKQDLRDEGPVVIGGSNVKSSFYLDLTEIKYLSREKYEESPEIKLQAGDVLLVQRGNGIGDVAYFDGSIEEATINPTMIIFSNFAGDPRYLFYYLSSVPGRENILTYASGSSIPAIYQKPLSKLQYPKPPLHVQKLIADILQQLDDKIELNRQMNETLEAMAQALFKSWFVDFDPVIDNALAAGNEIPEPLQKRAAARQALGDQRKPLPADIQSLFPERFVFTDEMGWIPEGWSIGELGSLLKQRVERVNASDYTRSVPYVPIDCISSKSLFLSESKDGEEAQSSLTKFYENDILFGAMRPYFHKVCIAPFNGTTRTTAFVLHPRKASDFAFSLLALHQEKTIEFATAHSTGTTIPYAKWDKSLSEYSLVVPPAELRQLFNDKVKFSLLKIPTKFSENRVLSGLRDTLLPKLLSGELRIPDVEKHVAEAL